MLTSPRPVFYFVACWGLRHEVVIPRQKSKLEDHPLSAILDWLFSIFTTILHMWRHLPSVTWERAMLWWQGTHLKWQAQWSKLMFYNSEFILPLKWVYLSTSVYLLMYVPSLYKHVHTSLVFLYLLPVTYTKARAHCPETELGAAAPHSARHDFIYLLVVSLTTLSVARLYNVEWWDL
jgi:hypothetical protein